MEQLIDQSQSVQAAVLILSDLAQVESRRLERREENFQALLKQYDEGQKHILGRFDEILRRLTERN
jgi:hypothetical protein